jgi:hypothetical protein
MINDNDREAAHDFGREGYYDDDRTRASGDAYFLAQVIGDVDRACDGLVRDFRAGRFDPGGWGRRNEFLSLVGAERDRPDEKPEYKQLDTAFADGGVEQNMDALADALDAFETGRARAFKEPAHGARLALERQIEQFRGDLTQRGAAGLSYAVDALEKRVLNALVLLGDDRVRRHVGNGVDIDPVVAIATLSGVPVSEVRARANRGNAVRKLSASLLQLDLSDWPTNSDDDIIRECAPVADWPREARDSRAGTTDNGSVDQDEADRIRIQRRDASWRTLS